MLPELKKQLPTTFQVYYEPFLGGGAVFFATKPKRSVLSDVNSCLIELYQVVRDHPKALDKQLVLHQSLHSKEYYYIVRNERPKGRIKRAARMLYLNRTCFNGLYRVNKKGEFNVPIGTKSSVVFEDECFKILSNCLKFSTLKVCDFEESISNAQNGDFLYVDPPYTVAHNTNGFLKYNDNIFSWDDQIRLRCLLEDAASRGVKIIMSNANHDSVIKLYEGFGKSEIVPRFSGISGMSKNRSNTTELLISVGSR